MINKTNSILLYAGSLYYNRRTGEDPKYSIQKIYKFNPTTNINDDVIVNTNASSSIFGPSYSYENSNRSKIRFSPHLK
jgi:hypothetical protein